MTSWSYLYHCVWSVITAHNLTPVKRDESILGGVLLVSQWAFMHQVPTSKPKMTLADDYDLPN